MTPSTRRLLDRAFSGVGLLSILLMAGALLVVLAPILRRGAGAIVFQATVEHRRLLLERFNRGSIDALEHDLALARAARQPLYDMIEQYQATQRDALAPHRPALDAIAGRDDSLGRAVRRRLQELNATTSLGEQLRILSRICERIDTSPLADNANLRDLKTTVDTLSRQIDPFLQTLDALRELLGPLPGDPPPVLPRRQYGQVRWDRAQIKLHQLLWEESWDHSGAGMGKKRYTPRADRFRSTPIEPLFGYVESHLDAILRPRWTLYSGFLTDSSLDAHIFGGIFPEILGTIVLTLSAILFAVPVGVVAAIYLTEYAQPGRLVSFLRTCVSTLAGVPSIVFGMFGLAFFLNTLRLPKGVLAGGLTLAAVILPTIIRASEEALRSVPHTYKEAALSLGASRWRTIATVILPAAMPGILTGIVISMGRAAGETAPIIFTAAASVAAVLSLNPLEAWRSPTAALSWNIYNLCTEHESADEIRHVQYGMVAVLVFTVLALNVSAILVRARISRRLRG